MPPPIQELQHEPPPHDSGDGNVKKEKDHDESAPYDPYEKFDNNDVKLNNLVKGGQNTHYAPHEDITHLRQESCISLYYVLFLVVHKFTNLSFSDGKTYI